MEEQAEAEEEAGPPEGKVVRLLVVYRMEAMAAVEEARAEVEAKVAQVAGEAVALSVYMFRVLTLLQ